MRRLLLTLLPLVCAAGVARAATNVQVVSGRYVGNGVTVRAITAVGFTPDVVLVKADAATPMVVRTATLGGGKELGPAPGNASNATIRSLDTNGFTVGASADVNATGVSYTWTALKGANGQLTFGSYTGTGVAGLHVNVGLGPAYVMVLPAGGAQATQRFLAQQGDSCLTFGGGGQLRNAITLLDGSGFKVGTANETNTAGATYHYLAARAANGIVAIGGYNGDGTDARAITGAGLRPYALLLAGLDGPPAVARVHALAGDVTLPAAAADTLAGAIESLDPDGFHVGPASATNGPGGRYSWIAFENATGFDLRTDAAPDRPVADELDTVTFRVTVTSSGPTQAGNVTVRVPVPPGTTYLSDAPSRGSYAPATGVWSVGNLIEGAQATLALVTRVNAGTGNTTLAGAAVAASGTAGELWPPSDSAPFAVRVRGVDLAVHEALDDATPREGGTITFRLSAVNHSLADPAHAITVTGITLPGAAFASAAGPGAFDAPGGTWTVGTLAAGDSAVLTVQAVVAPGTAGTSRGQTVAVQAQERDASLADNRDSVSWRPRTNLFRVVSGSYAGDGGASRRFGGLGFTPALVIVQGTNGGDAVARTRTMSGDGAKDLGATATLATGAITGFDVDGFTVGADTRVNAPGGTYYWTAFADAGGTMALGSYAGNDADNRAIAGLGFSPVFVLVLGSTNRATERFAAETGDASLNLQNGIEQLDRIQRLDADGFQLGTNADVNAGGATYHWVAWSAAGAVAGANAYTGDASDGRLVEDLGFRPGALLLARRDNGFTTLYRTREMGATTLSAGAGGGVGNAVQALTRRGFQVGAVGATNALGRSFVYAAFRDSVGADLEARVTVDNPAPNEQGLVTHTITLTNLGPQTATGVALSVPLPAGLAAGSVVVSRGVYDSTAGTWSLDSLPPGGATLALTRRVAAGTGGTTIVQPARILATAPADPVSTNNADSLAIAVQLVNVRVGITADDVTPTENEPVTCTVTLQNNGPNDATNLMATVPLPAALAYVSSSSSQGGYTPPGGAWSVGSLAAGATATLVLRAAPVAGTQGTSLPLRARFAGADQADHVAADDADSLTVDVKRGEFRVITGSYVGDGFNGHAVTGAGFQPDLLVVKGEGATAAIARVKGMPANSAKELGSATAPQASRVLSLDRDGFTVGSDASVNQPGVTYYWTAVLEAAGQIKVGSYVGNATDNRAIPTGFTPGYAIVLPGIAKGAQQRFAPQTADATLSFTGGENSDRIQTFLSDGFQIGTSADVNTAGATYYYAAFSAASPRLQNGIYLGNGTDDRTITGAGFRPTFAIAKSNGNNPAIVRPASVSGDRALPANAAAALSNSIQALANDGFQVGTDGTVNTSGKVYFWFAMRDLASTDVAVADAASDTIPNAGDAVTFAITVRNLGPGDATGVAVGHALGSGLVYRTHLPSRGVYDPVAGVWSLGSIVKGDSARLVITADVAAGTGGRVLADTAWVASLDQTDAFPANDRAATPLRVQAADLAVAVAADRQAANEWDPVTYTVTLTNRGPDPATNVAARDLLPAPLQFTGAVPSQGGYVANNGTWSVGTMAPGASATLVLQATIPSGAGGNTITDTATVVPGDQEDPTAADRAAAASVFVALAPGIQVSAAAGDSLARPGAPHALVLETRVLNSSNAERTVQRLVFTNRSSGAGTPAQLDAELGVATLYRDDGDGVFEPAIDAPVARASATGGVLRFDSLAVAVPSGTIARLYVAVAVPLTARDGDALDLSLDADTTVVLDGPTTFLNAWPVSPAGAARVDGMTAAQVGSGAALDTLVERGRTRQLAMDLVLPANGYDADVLQELRLSRAGDAGDADVARIEVWGDGGNGVFEAGGGDDFLVGAAAWNGGAWALTGLSIPILPGGRRLFVSADVRDSATIGRVVRLALADSFAVRVASGNDGPLDGAVTGARALTIVRAPTPLAFAALPQATGPAVPGAAGREVFALRIVNATAAAETLASVTFTNTTLGPGAVSPLDRDWLPLLLSDDLQPLGTATFAGGRATFPGLARALAPGDTLVLHVVSGASLVARDGDQLDLAVTAPGDVRFTRPIAPLGAWPLSPAGTFPVDGMTAAQIGVGPALPAEVLTGSVRALALDVVLPANGYEPDQLQFLLVDNAGNAAAGADVRKLEAWVDDGDGVFEPGAGDTLLGEMIYTGGGWALGGLATAVPVGGARIFVSCDIPIGATEGHTVRLELPVSPIAGVGMASDDDGPRDASVMHGAPMTITTENRVTLAPGAVPPGVVAPGDSQVVMLRLLAHNTYRDSTRTLTALTVVNAGSGPPASDVSERDQQVQSLQLRDGAAGGAVLATSYFFGGRATFAGFALDLLPGSTHELFVTALLPVGATDGAVLGAQIADESAIEFAPPSALSAHFPVGSGAAWTVDGMVARQLLAFPTRAVTLGPSDGPALALDVLIPRNGTRDDVLQQLSLVQGGDATLDQVADVRLWRDGGDGRFDGGAGDDRALTSMVRLGDRWVTPALTEPIGSQGLRLFAAVTSAATLADSSTLELQVPQDGIVVQSANDGPRDAALPGRSVVTLTNSALLTSVVLDRSAAVLGDSVHVHMPVKNTGSLAIAGIAPSPLVIEGTGHLAAAGPPVPATLDLAPGQAGGFDWTFVADGAGELALRGSAAGVEYASTFTRRSLATASAPLAVFSSAQDLRLDPVESMPFSVNRGQTQVVPLGLTLTHPGGANVSDILVRSVRVRFEDANGAGIVPASLIGRMVVNEGASVYFASANPPASGTTFDLTFARPARLRNAGTDANQVTLSLAVDVSDTTHVANFRLVIPDASAIVAEDATSGAPVSVALAAGQVFPVRSGLARVVASATRLDVAADSLADRRTSRGQQAVPMLQLALLNAVPIEQGFDIRVGGLSVLLVDGAGTPIARPASRISRVRVVAPSGTLLDRTLQPDDAQTLVLPLSPVLAVPVNQPVRLSVIADIADAADLGVVRMRLADSSSFVAWSTSSGAPLPAAYAAPVLAGDAVTVEAVADTLSARAVARFPARAEIGAAGLHALTLVLRHVGPVGTAAVRVDRLTFRCRDTRNEPVAPALLFSRAHLLRDGVEITSPATLPGAGGEFTVPLAGVLLAPGDSAALDLAVDVVATAPAGLYQIAFGADGAEAVDDNLGSAVTLVAAAGAEFPLGSGVVSLETPARELLAAFDDRMPAAMVAGALVPAARLALRQSGGSGQVRVSELDLGALTPARGALACGDALGRLEAWVADTLWAETTLAAGAATGALVGAAPLALGADPVTVELRVAPRAGTGGFRLTLARAGIVVVQPQSSLLAVTVNAEQGQTFPFETAAGSLSAASLAGSYSNFPNPFAAGREPTTFVYWLASAARVTLKLWTPQGDAVRTLIADLPRAAGLHEDAQWDGLNGAGRPVLHGAYVAELVAEYTDGHRERVLRKVAVVR